LTFNGLHGVVSQKIALFITTAVRTSNPPEVIGDWRKLHNEELHYLYNSNDQGKEDEMGKTCSTLGAKMNAYKLTFWWERQKERDH
jgi:hypothetical protein